LVLADSPSGLRYTTLRQSSIQPTVPKPKVTMSTIQMKRLERSAHNRVETPSEIRISAPPMVGVPDLIKCVCGPSLRTDWPIFLAASQRITAGPKTKEMASAVMVASTARRVM